MVLTIKPTSDAIVNSKILFIENRIYQRKQKGETKPLPEPRTSCWTSLLATMLEDDACSRTAFQIFKVLKFPLGKLPTIKSPHEPSIFAFTPCLK